MKREAGFSLIEMMVALVVMSLAAGLVVMNAGAPSGRLADETDALIRNLSAARDMALVENRIVTVEIDEHGYATRVMRRIGGVETTTQVDWRKGTSVATSDGRLPALVMFDSVGLAEAAEVVLFRDGAKDGVFVATSGRIGRLSDASQK
jgi:type II secretion system protein H